MKKRFRFCSALSATLLTFSSSAFAFSLDGLKGVDVSVAGGPSWYRSSNAYTQATPFETDTNQVSGVSRTGLYRVGVGYHVLDAKLSQRKFFNDLLAQVNVYHGNAAIKGTVLEYGSLNAENFTFRAPVSTTRLMLDLKPTLFTFHRLSPYAVAGAGVAWNRTTFYEQALSSSYSTYETRLPWRTQANLAYDLGFGVQGAITKHMSASVEYLSTHLGRVSPSQNASSTQTIAGAPHFPLRSQAVLVGLGWKF